MGSLWGIQEPSKTSSFSFSHWQSYPYKDNVPEYENQ